MQILGFSPRVYAEVRKFFVEHPVVEIKVRREANMASPALQLTGGDCQVCGWHWTPNRLFVDTPKGNLEALGEELPKGKLPGDFINAIEVTHAWDQASRAKYCGGLIQLSTSAA